MPFLPTLYKLRKTRLFGRNSFRFIGSLKLDVSRNPIHCDEKIQWIKMGEQQGWIDFRYQNQQLHPRYHFAPPTCLNYQGLRHEVTLRGRTKRLSMRAPNPDRYPPYSVVDLDPLGPIRKYGLK